MPVNNNYTTTTQPTVHTHTHIIHTITLYTHTQYTHTHYTHNHTHLHTHTHYTHNHIIHVITSITEANIHLVY